MKIKFGSFNFCSVEADNFPEKLLLFEIFKRSNSCSLSVSRNRYGIIGNDDYFLTVDHESSEDEIKKIEKSLSKNSEKITLSIEIN